jgi:hypothetical protein
MADKKISDLPAGGTMLLTDEVHVNRGDTTSYSITGQGLADLVAVEGTGRDNLVVVHDDTDLPTPISGVHQLADNCSYLFEGTITSANALKFGTNTTIYRDDQNPFAGEFVYTGSGAMIRGTNVDIRIVSVEMTTTHVDASVFAVTGASRIIIDRFICTCPDIGSIAMLGSGFQIFSFTNFNFFDATAGLVLAGEGINTFLIENGAFDAEGVVAFALLDLDSVIATVLRIKSIRFVMNHADQIGINSDNSGANATLEAVVEDCAFIIGTPTQGFDQASPLWDFTNNAGIQDSRTIGTAGVSDNSQDTTMAGVGTYQAIDFGTVVAGTTMERFSLTDVATGKLTYTGERDALVSIVLSISLIKSSPTKVYSFQIAKNGTVEGPSMSRSVTTATGNLSVISELALSTDDTIELYVKQVTATATPFTAVDFAIVVSG